MRQGLILFPKSTLGSGVNAFGWWREEAEALGISLRQAFFEDLTLCYGASRRFFIGGAEAELPDFVIMRGYAEEISLYFERAGIPVFNRWAAMNASHNKVLTHSILSTNGIPTPETFFREEALTYGEAATLAGGGTFVVKQPDSSRGNNVFLVRNAEEYDYAVGKCGGKILFQKYIASSHGRDLRVWTVGDRAAACVLRHSSTSFLSNYSQGGSAEAYDAPDEAMRLAASAAQAVGLDFAGVDLLFTEDGHFTVCEVNGNAGFRTLSACGGPDIVEIMVQDAIILSELKEMI